MARVAPSMTELGRYDRGHAWVVYSGLVPFEVAQAASTGASMTANELTPQLPVCRQVRMETGMYKN